MNKLTAIVQVSVVFLSLFLGLFWLLPGCKKEAHAPSIIQGRLTEYGTAAPVKDAKIYLSCDKSQFGGPPVTKLFDSLVTDTDGHFYKEYPAGQFCANVVIQPYKKGYFVPTSLDYVTVPKTYDYIMDPEAWVKVVTVPDGIHSYVHIGVGGDFSFEAWANQGSKERLFSTKGNRKIIIRWGPFSNPAIKYPDTLFLPKHDTTVHVIHY